MTAVKSMLPDAISRWEVDLAVVNGENSAGTGFGITEDTYQGIRGAGADDIEVRQIDARRHILDRVEHQGAPGMTHEAWRGRRLLDDGASRRQIAAQNRHRA